LSLSHAELRAANARHLLHPMADPKAVAGQAPLIVERAQGVHVYDLDGKRYLDNGTLPVERQCGPRQA